MPRPCRQRLIALRRVAAIASGQVELGHPPYFLPQVAASHPAGRAADLDHVHELPGLAVQRVAQEHYPLDQIVLPRLDRPSGMAVDRCRWTTGSFDVIVGVHGFLLPIVPPAVNGAVRITSVTSCSTWVPSGLPDPQREMVLELAAITSSGRRADEVAVFSSRRPSLWFASAAAFS